MRKVISVFVFCTVFILFGAIDYRMNRTEEETLPHFYRYKDRVERKRRFFEFMRPIIEKENEWVLDQRKHFLLLYTKRARKKELSVSDMKAFGEFAETFRVDTTRYETGTIWESLKRRIDIVPIELALAQSASESAWGMSRFAIRGNAMFGQWSFSRKKKGMIPIRRDPKARHAVAAFPSVRDAVKSYIMNLNTHPAYAHFRRLRSQAREKGSEPDGHALAAGLIYYSEKRIAYVREIQKIIVTNKSLMDLDL